MQLFFVNSLCFEILAFEKFVSTPIKPRYLMLLCFGLTFHNLTLFSCFSE